MADVGRLLALLHDGGLIHGDLTTSNMLVREVRRTPGGAQGWGGPDATLQEAGRGWGTHLGRGVCPSADRQGA